MSTAASSPSFMWQWASSVVFTSSSISCIVTCSQQREPSSRPTNRLSVGLFLQAAGCSRTHKLKDWAQQRAVIRDTWASTWQCDPAKWQKNSYCNYIHYNSYSDYSSYNCVKSFLFCQLLLHLEVWPSLCRMFVQILTLSFLSAEEETFLCAYINLLGVQLQCWKVCWKTTTNYYTKQEIIFNHILSMVAMKSEPFL